MNATKDNFVNRRGDRILGLLTAVVFICVAIVSTLEKALAFAVFFGAFSAVVQSKWHLRNDRWFQVTVAFLVIVHILVLSLVHIPELRFGLISLPFALADGFAMWGLINWLERRFAAPDDSDPSR